MERADEVRAKLLPPAGQFDREQHCAAGRMALLLKLPETGLPQGVAQSGQVGAAVQVAGQRGVHGGGRAQPSHHRHQHVEICG